MAEVIQIRDPEARRTPSDRRGQPTRMLSRHTLVGRRRRNRRTTDPQVSYYVDWISGSYLVALIMVLLLILTDTVSTLHIISRGGDEVNPIMRWMLDLSPFWFAFVKTATALAAFLLLAVHRYFPVARILTTVLLLAYGALVCYHVLLLFAIHG